MAVSLCTALTEEEIEFIRELDHKEAVEEGLKEGLERGLEQGMKQGLEQGMKQGLKEGLEQGLEQGLKEGLEQGSNRVKTVVDYLLKNRRAEELQRALVDEEYFAEVLCEANRDKEE